MRPKKVILLAALNAEDASVMKFMLETNGYRVIVAPGPREAWAAVAAARGLAPGRRVDLVIVDLASAAGAVSGARLGCRLRGAQDRPKLLALGSAADFGDVDWADRCLRREGGTAAELLDCVKLLCVSKRGPRRQRESGAAVAAGVAA